MAWLDAPGLVVLRPLHPTPTAWNLHARHRLDLASGERGGYDTTTPPPAGIPSFGRPNHLCSEVHLVKRVRLTLGLILVLGAALSLPGGLEASGKKGRGGGQCGRHAGGQASSNTPGHPCSNAG